MSSLNNSLVGRWVKYVKECDWDYEKYVGNYYKIVEDGFVTVQVDRTADGRSQSSISKNRFEKKNQFQLMPEDFDPTSNPNNILTNYQIC